MTEDNSKPTTPRRRFLQKLVGSVAALGIVSAATPLSVFSKAAAPQPGNDNIADQWFNQVKGKHRIVYDATNPHAGFPLAWSWVFLKTNNDTGTPDNDLCVVVVLRHEAIVMAMAATLWAKYKFGEMAKVDDNTTKAPSLRNIYWESKHGDLSMDEWAIDKLQKRGVLFCVCAMAIHAYSGSIATKMSLNAAAVEKELLAGVLPGIQIVPSGVWAVGRAQEHNCAYCFAG
jgi:intracellular sulfur oxidation DsrE/DsrF family protein